MISRNELESLRRELAPGKLLAVTKNVHIQELQALYNYGQRDFCENRLESLSEKIKESTTLNLRGINWHFIGQIQSNKLNKILDLGPKLTIHSVTHEKYLKTILDHPIRHSFFLQCNLTGESEKSGLRSYEEIRPLLDLIKSSPQGLTLFKGIMGMGPIRTESFKEDTRTCFEALDDLRQKVALSLGRKVELSMGMSQDYKIAKEYESDYFRIGSFLYNE